MMVFWDDTACLKQGVIWAIKLNMIHNFMLQKACPTLYNDTTWKMEQQSDNAYC